jgi:hypothetical protein
MLVVPDEDRSMGPIASGMKSQDVGENQVITPADGSSGHERSSSEAAKYNLMLTYLRQRQLNKQWAGQDSRDGVMLKRSKNDYICLPPDLPQHIDGFYDEVKRLNVKVCIIICIADSITDYL